jgi:calcineurin-like phosphoesterase family protein
MSNTFLVSDTHFGHWGVCKFLAKDGVNKLRPWSNPQDMDEDMIQRWNSVVKPTDKVYHLGDVVINRHALSIMPRLNGRKVLIKGNHDIFKLSDYLPHFYDIRAYHVLDRMILSHIPVHVSNLARFGANIHGHTHDRNVLLEDGSLDSRYQCVCVEQTDFTPIEFGVIRQRVASLV